MNNKGNFQSGKNSQSRSNNTMNRNTQSRRPQSVNGHTGSGQHPKTQQNPNQNMHKKPLGNREENAVNPRANMGRTPIKKPDPKRVNSDQRMRKIPENPPKQRRRNEESYVFSRSLSETRERILTERKERLEDAKAFRKEDIHEKVKKGLIALVAVILLISIIVSVSVTCALNAGKVKKNDGEYIFKIGKNDSYPAYEDKAKKGVIYISMNTLSELCNFSMTGSTNELRFTTEDKKNYISFSPNSAEANINGYGMPMQAPAIMEETNCSIPLSFVKLVFGGLKVDIDEKKNTVTVLREEYNDSTPLEPHYHNISFMLKVDSALSSLDENKYFAGQPIFAFKNDLKNYEKYMNPQGQDKDAFLILLNKEHTVGSDYEPENLIHVTGVPKEYWLVETAAKAVEAMVKEMHSEGFTDIFVTSAYRSYNYQSALYNTYIDNEMRANPSLTYDQAKAIVEGYSAIPGKSEHHTGLCVDFMSTKMTELNNDFEKNPAFEWLMANAWKFGFILRYPEDKTDITKYDYESWHWRYVGRSHALEILKNDWCFEEYLQTHPELSE